MKNNPEDRGQRMTFGRERWGKASQQRARDGRGGRDAAREAEIGGWRLDGALRSAVFLGRVEMVWSSRREVEGQVLIDDAFGVAAGRSCEVGEV